MCFILFSNSALYPKGWLLWRHSPTSQVIWPPTRLGIGRGLERWKEKEARVLSPFLSDVGKFSSCGYICGHICGLSYCQKSYYISSFLWAIVASVTWLKPLSFQLGHGRSFLVLLFSGVLPCPLFGSLSLSRCSINFLHYISQAIQSDSSSVCLVAIPYCTPLTAAVLHTSGSHCLSPGLPVKLHISLYHSSSSLISTHRFYLLGVSSILKKQ